MGEGDTNRGLTRPAVAGRARVAFARGGDGVVRLTDLEQRDPLKILFPDPLDEPQSVAVLVDTGGCPHTAIREDASANLAAVAAMTAKFPGLELLSVESGLNRARFRRTQSIPNRSPPTCPKPPRASTKPVCGAAMSRWRSSAAWRRAG
jgi:hypothetical protein